MTSRKKSKLEVESSNLVQCRKCGRKVEKEKQAMWEHAIRFHTTDFLNKIHDQAITNERGTDGLFSIGFDLGKQLQGDNVSFLSAVSNLVKGLSRDTGKS